MKRVLVLVALSLSAAFAQDADLARLAERLLVPWPDPTGTTMTLVTELPDDLPLVLPLPENTDLLGSQVWRSADGSLQSVQIVADSTLDVGATWFVLAEAFEGKGWEVRLDQAPTGFVPQENSLSGLFCAPVGGTHMYVNVNPREGEPTDLRLNLNLVSPDDPCAYPPVPMYGPGYGGEGFAPLPTLYAPEGVDITVHASPIYNNQGSSAAVLFTDMGQEDLMAHYGAQLAAAGWEEGEPGRWRFVDESGIEWAGVLSVTPLPGGAHFATFGVVVTSRG